MFKRMVRALCFLGLTVLSRAAIRADSIPHLEKTGSFTRLIVHNQPFLVLGGEVHNSSSSNLDYMKPVWPKLASLNINTVLVPVSWELLEPQEGKFDFSLVDGLIGQARDNHLHIILIWFGSWKNAVSTYAPGWVKTELKRFPRAQDENGKNLNALSTFGKQTREADARAFVGLMKHIRETDSTAHTVIMVQVENEVGLLGTQRDFAPVSEAAFKDQVPKSLLAYLAGHKETLGETFAPELLRAWEDSGLRPSGTWEQLFGATHAAAEAFMAWQYAQYIDAVAARGKAEYPLPMYVNAWLVQSGEELAGQYPSGGPVYRVLDIWRAGAPHLDLFAPDIYVADFRSVCAPYVRSRTPLFIPETNNETASSYALYAFGQGALGFSVFAPEELKTDGPLTQTYSVLAQLSPLLLANIAHDSVASVVQQRESATALDLGGYTFLVEYSNHKEEASVPPAAALIIKTADDEFIVAGTGLSIQFAAQSAGPRNVDLLQVDEGTFVNTKWVSTRRLNGDEIDSGSHLLLPADRIAIQRVKLFRHE